MKRVLAMVFIFSLLSLIVFGSGMSLSAFKKGLTEFEGRTSESSQAFIQSMGQYRVLKINSVKIVSYKGKTYVLGSMENISRHTIIGGYVNVTFLGDGNESGMREIVYVTPFVLRSGQKGYFCANVKGHYEDVVYSTGYATVLLTRTVKTVYDLPYEILSVKKAKAKGSDCQMITFDLSYENTIGETLTGVTATIYGIDENGNLTYVGKDVHYWKEMKAGETYSAIVSGVELSKTSCYGIIIQGMKTLK